MLEAKFGCVPTSQGIIDIPEKIRNLNDVQVDEKVHEIWGVVITDKDKHMKYWKHTRDIGQDRYYCWMLGVKDYTNLPTNDWRRVQLYCLYLVSDYHLEASLSL